MLFRSEREVEVNLLAPLFQDVLGYPESDLEWAKSVRMSFGREVMTKQADLVISRSNRPLIAVEAKKPTESVQSAIDQVDSYAYALHTPYSVITNGRHLVVRGYYSANRRLNVIDDNIDTMKSSGWAKLKGLIAFDKILGSINDPAGPVVEPNADLIKDYRRFFKKIHNAIRDSDKLDPASAFDELSKLLFLKAAEDERELRAGRGSRNALTVAMVDQWDKLGRGQANTYVNNWFSAATSELFPDVFDDGPKIELSPTAIMSILPLLDPFHVKGGDLDVKGRAFEEFLPTQLRGKGLGQFFTPRPVVNFISELAEVSIQDVVVDFACGSGGFLIKAFEKMRSSLDLLPAGTLTRIGTSQEALLNDIKDRQLFGIDAEPRAARTAKMNMLMWGDGRRVVRGNALAALDHSGNPYAVVNYDPKSAGSGCTLIMANPPFGAQEKDPLVLSQYDLGARLKAKISQKTEILFIEKGLRLLRPEGRMIIVLPMGLMGADTYADVRNYILSRADIRAIVSLPTHTFSQSGVPTVNTCVLYVQKFTESKAKLFKGRYGKLADSEAVSLLKADPDFDYGIFMASAEHIGFEPSGRVIGSGSDKNDLDLILEDFRAQHVVEAEPVDLFAFASLHYGPKSYRRREQTVRGTTKGLKTSFTVSLSDTDDRLDPAFYLFRTHAMPTLSVLPEIGDRLIERKGKFSPSTDEELDEEYKVLSVSNDGGISHKMTVKGEDLDQKYKRVYAGDIAYNPMRANVGSFGVVTPEHDGGLISPDYFVMTPRGLDPHFVVTLLGTPYYRMYIDVVTTGSIRDRLYPDGLKRLRIPEMDAEQQITLYGVSRRVQDNLDIAVARAIESRTKINDRVRDLITGAGQSSPISERFNALEAEWERATGHVSSYTDIISHPTYEAIVRLGAPALPLILGRLRSEPMFWFSALERISGANPVKPVNNGSVTAAADAWLKWGKKKGIVG
jgi:type I restriction enzyme M protein